jgi:membrane fusion protein (multidrug efflux system)
MNDMSKIAAGDAVEAADVPMSRRFGRLAIMLSVPLLLALGGSYFWLTGGKTVSTDNAQVNARVVQVSAEIAGRVSEVFVTENQHVRKGDLLVRLDPVPYQIALMQADAAVGNAQLSITQMESNFHAKEADTQKSVSDVNLARDTFKRQQELLARGFTTHANYDAAKAGLAAAEAEQASARSSAESAQAMLGRSSGGGHPQVEAAIAMRDKAKYDLKRTEIRAPIDGIVSQTDKLAPGTMAMQMLPLINVVSADGYWIDANFKETQLATIKIGQRADITMDAIPGKTFAGHVIGIGAGTGSQFSVLPAQNATGNWVKVTQRVPVRVALDEKPEQPLVAGSSAHVTVHVAD